MHFDRQGVLPRFVSGIDTNNIRTSFVGATRAQIAEDGLRHAVATAAVADAEQGAHNYSWKLVNRT